MRERVGERQAVEELDLGELPMHGTLAGAVPARPVQAGVGVRGRVYTGVAAWMIGVFLLCYLALPTALHALGVNDGLLSGLGSKALGFGATTCLVMAALELFRPRLDLTRRADPVLPAAAGALATWAVVHNTSDLLVPFARMDPLELGSLIALNLVEVALVGVVLASFARSRLHALVLGVCFELVLMGTLLLAIGRAPF